MTPRTIALARAKAKRLPRPEGRCRGAVVHRWTDPSTGDVALICRTCGVERRFSETELCRSQDPNGILLAALNSLPHRPLYRAPETRP